MYEELESNLCVLYGSDLSRSMLCDMSDSPYIPLCCPQSRCATSLLVPGRLLCICKGQNWWPRDPRQRWCLWGFVARHTKWCHCVLWGISCIFEGLGLSYIWDMGISQRMNLCQSSLMAFAIFLCGIKNRNCCASAILIITEEGKVWGSGRKLKAMRNMNLRWEIWEIMRNIILTNFRVQKAVIFGFSLLIFISVGQQFSGCMTDESTEEHEKFVQNSWYHWTSWAFWDM